MVDRRSHQKLSVWTDREGGAVILAGKGADAYQIVEGESNLSRDHALLKSKVYKKAFIYRLFIVVL